LSAALSTEVGRPVQTTGDWSPKAWKFRPWSVVGAYLTDVSGGDLVIIDAIWGLL